jgi:outer membrane protein insertion porin family/translocation and assembly module TamA
MRRALAPALLIAVCVATAACNEEGAVQVKKLSFTGVAAVEEARIRGALATRQSSRLPWGRKFYFDRGRFDADLKRIEAFYADRGFPDARVTGFDVKLNDVQDAVEISVIIAEGDPVIVTAVEFTGFEAVPPDHFEELKQRVPLKVGQPRDRALVVATHEIAINELRDHGHPYAKVSSDERPEAQPRQVALVFAAAPGPLARFGPIEIAGHESVGDSVILRKLNFRPGDLYRRSVVQDTQRQLYQMELFQFVNIETVDPEKESPEVPIRVTVAEGKHQRVNFGVGYGTEEHGRVDGEYHHVNFLGGARSAGVHARWSSLDRGIRLDFSQPYVFSPHLSLGLEGQQWYTFTPAYQSIVTGAKTTLVHRATPRQSWSASIMTEQTSSVIDNEVLTNPEFRDDLIALAVFGLDPTTGRQDGVLNAIGTDFQHSTADNLLNARRGYQLAVHAESAGRLLPGSFNYYAVSADARHYVPIGESIVIANRVQLGNIDQAGEDPKNVPFSKKYFLGGASSVRGWGRYEISPLSGSGFPIGGNTMFAFSSELRAVLRGNFGGVLFLDAGNVWTEGWTIHLRDLRYAIGPGLRYQTPVGPVRFDVGWQVNPIPGLLVNGAPQSRRWRMHFSIGQAF